MQKVNYGIFSQYYENGILFTIQDGGIRSFCNDDIESAFALNEDGLIEEIIIENEPICDGEGYEIFLKKSGERIGYESISCGFFGEKIKDKKKKICNCISLPFIMINTYVEAGKRDEREVKMPLYLEELSYMIQSGVCTKLFYIAGYKQLVLCDVEINYKDDEVEIIIYNKETHGIIVAFKTSLVNQYIKNIYLLGNDKLKQMKQESDSVKKCNRNEIETERLTHNMKSSKDKIVEYVVEGNYVEIYFSTIPNDKIRETLKICGWHWFGKKKCWRNYNTQENIKWAKALCEELNPKSSSPLFNLKKCKIGMIDLLVRSNSFYCNQHHTLEDVAGEVEVRDKKGNLYCYLIPIVYCKSCNVYYVLEETYLALKEKGVIRCQILTYKAYVNDSTTKYGEFNEVSPLRQWGYTTSQEEGYTDRQRQAILEDILDYGIMSKDKMLSYLDFFIRLNQHKYDLALGKWKEDREYIAQYKIGTAKSFRIGSITTIDRR